MNYVVIFAGGVGSRMGSDVPKQFLKVDNKPIIIHTIEKFENNDNVAGIVVVSKSEYVDLCNDLIKEYKIKKVIDVIEGGETGQLSIFNGVSYLYNYKNIVPEEDIVLIHDGVRPFIDDDLINRSIACARENGNSIAVSKAIETVVRTNSAGEVIEAIDRSECRNAKAPQCFILETIYKAHLWAQEHEYYNVVDSATLMKMLGEQLFAVECGPENIKITTPNDYFMFKAMYESLKGRN